VHVDQPWHQGSSTAVDDSCTRRADRFSRNLLDHVSFDQHIAGRAFFVDAKASDTIVNTKNFNVLILFLQPSLMMCPSVVLWRFTCPVLESA